MWKKFLALSAVILLMTFFAGCAPKKVRIDYAERAAKIKTIGLLAPDLVFNELTIGIGRERRFDWSEQANRNFIDTLTEELKARGYEVRLIQRDGQFKESADEIDSLFYAIVYSFRMHASNEPRSFRFPHKVEVFDYSVGPVDDILDANRADALFLIGGIGEGGSVMLQGGVAVWMTLIDRTGTLLWLQPYISREQSFTTWDIREPKSVNVMVKTVLETMPEVPK